MAIYNITVLWIVNMIIVVIRVIKQHHSTTIVMLNKDLTPFIQRPPVQVCKYMLLAL